MMRITYYAIRSRFRLTNLEYSVLVRRRVLRRDRQRTRGKTNGTESENREYDNATIYDGIILDMNVRVNKKITRKKNVSTKNRDRRRPSKSKVYKKNKKRTSTLWRRTRVCFRVSGDRDRRLVTGGFELFLQR